MTNLEKKISLLVLTLIIFLIFFPVRFCFAELLLLRVFEDKTDKGMLSSITLNVLLTFAANLRGETWSSSSDARKLNFLLYGVESVNYDVN